MAGITVIPPRVDLTDQNAASDINDLMQNFQNDQFYIDEVTGDVWISTTTKYTGARISILNTSAGSSDFAIVGGSSVADSTNKITRIGCAHYINAEEPVGLIVGSISSAINAVSIGGGTGTGNAATEIKLYTAPDTTTLTGTVRIIIDSSGKIATGGETAPDVVPGGIHIEMDGTVGDAIVVKDGTTEYFSVSNLGIGTFAGTIEALTSLQLNTTGDEVTLFAHPVNGFSVNMGSGIGSDKLAVGLTGRIYMRSLGTLSGKNDVQYDTSTFELGYVSSSLRYKENIRKEIDTEWIYELPVVMYDRKDGSRQDEIGVIAESIHKENKNYCSYDSEGNVESYSRLDLVPLLLNELQKHKKEIDNLKSKLN